MGGQSYKNLKKSFERLCDLYQGSLNDTGMLESLSTDIVFEGFDVHIATVIIDRRKYTNRYAISILSFKNKAKQRKTVIPIKNALNYNNLVRIITKLISDPVTDK